MNSGNRVNSEEIPKISASTPASILASTLLILLPPLSLAAIGICLRSGSNRESFVYGLTVRYQIGGDAFEGEDYKYINGDNSWYGSFFIPPGAQSYSF